MWHWCMLDVWNNTSEKRALTLGKKNCGYFIFHICTCKHIHESLLSDEDTLGIPFTWQKVKSLRLLL